MIRELNVKEAEKLLSLAKKDGVTFSKGTLFGYTKAGVIVSIASVTYGTVPKLKTAYTLKEERGNGFATKLLKYRLFVLKEKGYKMAKANCKPMSTNLHLSVGGTVEKKYENGITLIKHLL